VPTDRDAPRSADAPLSFGPPAGAPAAAAASTPSAPDANAAGGTTAPARAPGAPLPPLDGLRDAFGALLRAGALAADAPPAAVARSAELRAAVSADVHALRASGLPPEAVVIAVKARARDALRLALADSPPAAGDLAASLLAGDRRQRAEEWLARAVSWCIDEYYSP
jgi:hypothetical protein